MRKTKRLEKLKQMTNFDNYIVALQDSILVLRKYTEIYLWVKGHYTYNLLSKISEKNVCMHVCIGMCACVHVCMYACMHNG